MLDQFYRKYGSELKNWCRAMTRDASLAEDLVQEAFLRAMSNLPLLETLSETQQKAWFYRTIKNMYLDQIRHSRYETAVEAIPDTLSVMEEYSQIDLEQLLNSLPGKEGVLFVMRYLEGYNSKEIGEFFRMPPGTVRAQLALARKHLKEAFCSPERRKR